MIRLPVGDPSESAMPATEAMSRQRKYPSVATLSCEATTSRPIRVCYVIDRLGFGGTETHLVRLINALDRNYVIPYLCLLDGMDEESWSLEPAACETMRLGVVSLCSLKAVRQALTLASALRKWQIDILQLHFPDSNYFGTIVGRLAGVRRIVTTRRDLFYWVTPLQKKLGPWLDSIYHRRFVDALLANCRACVYAVEKAGIPMPPRTAVIANGIDLDSLISLPVSGSLPESGDQEKATRPIHVGAVTMLRPEKRLDLLVEAAAMVCREEDVVFEVVGEGRMRPSLERKIRELDLDARFMLPGLCNNVKGFLGDLDIAVLCSDSEGLSNALIEYMAAGRAVVATNVGGTAEVIDHGVTGLLVPPGDPVALAAAIRRLATDAPLRQSLGAAAREFARNTFSTAAMVEAHQAFYIQLCAAPR